MSKAYDTLIIGGGPAGLAAAMVLGRCMRSVLLCDAGRQRNLASRAIHALPGQDGRPPPAFLTEVRCELGKYKTVELRAESVGHVEKTETGFAFACAGGFTGHASTLLIATGLVDTLPDIPETSDYYGVSIHHCLYCDGAEYVGRPLVALGKGEKGAALALMMSHWSADVIACCDGVAPGADWERRLAERAIPVIISPIHRLIGASGKLQAVSFADGDVRPCEALFFSTGCTQGSSFADQLGCRRDEDGNVIKHPRTEQTTERGIYVAGDVTKDVLLVAVAIGEGAKAGVAINRALLKEEGRI